MANVRDGEKIPPIDSALLDAVETPVDKICEICGAAKETGADFFCDETSPLPTVDAVAELESEQGEMARPTEPKRRNKFAKVEELITELGDTDEKTAVVLMVNNGGKMAYSNFLTEIGIEAKTRDRSQASQQFHSLKKRVNNKLDSIGWLLDRKKNNVELSRKRPERRQGKKKTRKSKSR